MVAWVSFDSKFQTRVVDLVLPVSPRSINRETIASESLKC